MRVLKILALLGLLFSLAACSFAGASGDPGGQSPSPIPRTIMTGAAPQTASETERSFTTRSPAAGLPATEPPRAASIPSTPEPAPTLAVGAWMSLPVIPDEVSPQALEIYRHGLELGNNPRAFSKIGDCGSTPAWFLGDFDRGPQFYRLGEHQDLAPAIAYYTGSFGRTSLAAREGFNASSVFASLWANRSQCSPDETPLACEYRVNRPSLAFIMLGTNDVWHKEDFEPQMRKIIEFSIEKGVIPVLTTKADNTEKDGSLNATIASLSVEYGLPLWNYWLAVQDLPGQGLQEDRAHLTWAPNRFDDPQAMQKAWPVRNLTALQILDLLRRSLEN